MSRIGNRIIQVPEKVTLTLNQNLLEVKGEKGVLQKEFSPLIAIEIKDGQVTTLRANEEKHTKSLHGTTNSLIQSMIKGVSEGFKKELVIKGVGYKASLKGEEIEINAGYSHPHLIKVLPGVKVEVTKPTEITVSGIDKEIVGQMAALIKNVRKPSPYSGKGISYKGEQIRRKEGKTASK